MKRLCFDTESTYFKPPGSDIGTPAEHREYLRGKRISFRCAVVFDESTGRYQEFDERETSELVSVLSSADELISHSGKRVDLIVLEHACGEDRIALLWQIRHHDLFEIFNWASLDSLGMKYLPEILPTLEGKMKERQAGTKERTLGQVGWAPPGHIYNLTDII